MNLAPEPGTDGADSVRQARVAWRRRQIIDSATRLMERDGFHGMSMQALAEDAGVSVGLIYQYVASKDDVLMLVIMDIVDAYKAEVPVVTAGHEDPCEQLAAAFRRYCEINDQRRAATLLTYRETAALSEENRNFLKAHETETTEILSAIVRRGIASGVFNDSEDFVVAYNLAMAAHAWALKYWFYRHRLSLEQYVRAQLELQLRALVVPSMLPHYAHLFAAETEASSAPN